MEALLGAMREALPGDAIAPPDGPTGQESRRFPRIADHCAVRLKWPRGLFRWGVHETVTRDLSLNGVCCGQLATALPKGSRLRIDLLPIDDGDWLVSPGEVAWCRWTV